MIEAAGVVTAKDFSPYIYFIKKGYLLYIGETQRNPILRWSEHLHDGSFRKALFRADEEIYLSDLYTEFYAYRCVFIETGFREVERKRATQFVEHQLHIRVICKGVPSDSVKLISDTTRTAPMSYKYRGLSNSVSDLYDMFVNDLTSKKNCVIER